MEEVYDQTKLESIENILIPTWRRDLHLIKDLTAPKSILLLIDTDKLSAINTSAIKTSMKLAKFHCKYICSIQVFKHEISSKKSRLKYNNELSDMKDKRNQLMKEREELINEINAFTQIEPYLVHSCADPYFF